MFPQDLKLPEMLTAVVAHAPRFGARRVSFDATAVQGIPGIRQVIEIPSGVASSPRTSGPQSRAATR